MGLVRGILYSSAARWSPGLRLWGKELVRSEQLAPAEEIDNAKILKENKPGERGPL